MDTYDAKNAELDARFTASVKAIGDGIDHLKLANAALCESIDETHRYIRRMQDVMVGYLQPDGCDADEALNILIEMLDGPAQREIQKRAFAALSLARGEQFPRGDEK